MNDEVYGPGEVPDTKRWYVKASPVTGDGLVTVYDIITPGGYSAAWTHTLNDARQIVGELNHVAELREQLARLEDERKLRVEKMRELMQGQDIGALERIEQRIEALMERVGRLEAITGPTR